MIELHHGGPSAETLKLMIALNEKALAYETRALDVGQFEQWSDRHRALAPQGELPVLVDDGEVMTLPGVALQYLAEAYPHPRLAPTDPFEWYETQAWNATIDGALAPNVALLGWISITTPGERDAHRQRLAAVPNRQRPAGWAAVLADAEASEDQLANARDRIADAVGRIEQALERSGWLVGDAYSIADINTFALVHTLPRLLPGAIAGGSRTAEWLERIQARPAVAEALAPAGQRDCYAPPG